MTARALFHYLVRLGEEVGLYGWTFLLGEPLSPEGQEGEALAKVTVTYGRRVAVIRFSSDLLLRSPAEQRHALCHELLHCHLERIADAARSGSHRLGDEARAVAEDALRDSIEYAVDALADAWAPSLPLPPRRRP